MDDKNLPVVLSTIEVAKLLKCSVPTARALMLRRDFPAFKVGKNYKVEQSALLAWCSTRHLD